MAEQHDLSEFLQNVQLNHFLPNKDKSHLKETKALFYERKVKPGSFKLVKLPCVKPPESCYKT